ncbi:MAG: MBL fold metallo-hydrolase [Deltaproteobacteria bacterium]|nr:MBL fold metallo-hydrolase [Deltaproteobacteria bacterium]MBW1946998.1 MBL fold metallo-hydrolase [Deltaproteobacteria bacterium]MBW1966710.1 MBL fold metallo-hydrolase [Deltaproteobacteria bacterium]MBW2097272.1 MBL fold metallo-hydrolase [Deltaproteobacteria bacterium]PXF54429.1 MAG: MBL fold metallo-hydrolase [Deltaproteobacteria bacterium]
MSLLETSIIMAGSVLIGTTACSGLEAAEGYPSYRLTVVFNNIPYATNLRTGWGFACLIEGFQQTILFDTGSDGDILLSNMKGLGIDPGTVSAVVLSHIHADHCGGLERFLRRNPKVTVYLPESFPVSFIQAIQDTGAHVRKVGKPAQLLPHVYSTGEMGEWIREQSLILETPKNLVIITGCAHPGIVHIVEKAKDLLKKDIYMVVGGFHLAGTSTTRIREIIQGLKDLGVEKVAPSHCTGEEAIGLFKKSWGKDFVEGGCGAVIPLGADSFDSL